MKTEIMPGDKAVHLIRNLIEHDRASIRAVNKRNVKQSMVENSCERAFKSTSKVFQALVGREPSKEEKYLLDQ